MQSLISKAIANNKPKATVQEYSAPVQHVAAPAPVLAQPVPQPQAATQIDAEVLASQDKIKEMAKKLGIPFTNDLLALGSNAAISDALIEKAVALGRTEAQINAAMATL